MLLSQQYNALLDKTDYFGLSLYSIWNMENEDPFRNAIVKYPPPWLLQFRTGPTAEVTKQIDRTIKIYVNQLKEEVSLNFHSRTGKFCFILFDFLNPKYLGTDSEEELDDERYSRLGFFTDFITYMRGIDTVEFPPITEKRAVPSLELHKLKWLAESTYGKYLKDSYFSRKPQTTQDYTFLYKITLTEMLLILHSNTLEKAVYLLEAYRSEFEE